MAIDAAIPLMGSDQRLDEIAAILATGLSRLGERENKKRQSDSSYLPAKSLDFCSHESVSRAVSQIQGQGHVR
jgi:hypothetical protein